MPQNNYKEFVFCNKCHNYPCHCKKNEVINMYKRPNNYYNTTTNNEQNNCSIVQKTDNAYSTNTIYYNKFCKKRPRRKNNKFYKANCNTNNCNINNCNMNSCNPNRRRGFCGLSWLLLFLFFL